MNLLQQAKADNAELEETIKELSEPVRMDFGSWVITAILMAASFGLTMIGLRAIIGS